jgi:hypothetical protein
MIFLLTGGRGLWQGEDTETQRRFTAPVSSGFFVHIFWHDNQLWRVDRAEYKTFSGKEYAQPSFVWQLRPASHIWRLLNTKENIMPKSSPAVTAKPSHVVSFPTKDKPVHWRDRFKSLYDQGKGTMLGFPFTCIREKQALLDLYEAVPVVLKDYPGVVDKFFEDADISMDVAEESIEKKRLRNAAGDPDALIRFRPAAGREVTNDI